MRRRRLAMGLYLVGVLLAHAGLALHGAWLHSPGIDEPAHLVAGLSHWQTGSFALYRVNPPLPDLLASLPVLAMRPVTDFSRLSERVDIRDEWNLGWDFSRANAPRLRGMMFAGRIPGIVWSLAAACLILAWCRALLGEAAACVAITFWCFDPLVLAWSRTITGDIPAATAAIASTYAFWRFARAPSWPRAAGAGVLLGVALLSKFTLLALVPLLPLLTLPFRPWETLDGRHRGRFAGQLASSLALALVVLNLGYGFRGSFRRLGDYVFVSQALSGNPRPSEASPASGTLGVLGNRFRDTPLAMLPVPIPADYLSGIDVLRTDFEDELESYLRGVWRRGGWWYYYIVGMAVKQPLGSLALILAAVASGLPRLRSGRRLEADTAMWLLPALALFAFVSSQTGTSHHVRYILPCFPFLAVGIGGVMESARGAGRVVQGSIVALLAWSLASTLLAHPHVMSYFNEAAGGPANGRVHLNDSNLDWGQDLYFLQDWLDRHPEARPLHLAYHGYFDPAFLGIEYRLPPSAPPLAIPSDPHEAARFGPRPGHFAISVNFLLGSRFFAPNGRGGVRPVLRRGEYHYFNGFEPIDRAGHSIDIFHVSRAQADEARLRLGLPPCRTTSSSPEPDQPAHAASRWASEAASA